MNAIHQYLGWFIKSTDDNLMQGDVLFNCPVLLPNQITSDCDSELEETREVEYSGEISYYNVVIVSQTCDILQRKTKQIIVCPIYDIEDMIPVLIDKNQNTISSLENIRKGRVEGFLMLGEFIDVDTGWKYRIVNFREVYGIPLEIAILHAGKQIIRPRLLSPYREHLAHEFGKYFMRIALPHPIRNFV